MVCSCSIECTEEQQHFKQTVLLLHFFEDNTHIVLLIDLLIFLSNGIPFNLIQRNLVATRYSLTYHIFLVPNILSKDDIFLYNFGTSIRDSLYKFDLVHISPPLPALLLFMDLQSFSFTNTNYFHALHVMASRKQQILD